MRRIVIAGLAGGIAIFMWGAIAHTALPLGTLGIRQIPDEGFVVVALRNSVTEKGLYFVPGRDMTKSMTPQEEKNWDEKLKTGPTGLLLVNPSGGEAMSLKQLGTEFITNVVAALTGAFLISRVVGSYFSRAFFSMLVGLLGWLSISVPYWNWYGYPTEFTLAAGIEEVIGGLIAGLVIAWIVPTPGVEKSLVSAV